MPINASKPSHPNKTDHSERETYGRLDFGREPKLHIEIMGLKGFRAPNHWR
jgi:hypothetical protein